MKWNRFGWSQSSLFLEATRKVHCIKRTDSAWGQSPVWNQAPPTTSFMTKEDAPSSSKKQSRLVRTSATDTPQPILDPHQSWPTCQTKQENLPTGQRHSRLTQKARDTRTVVDPFRGVKAEGVFNVPAY